MTALLDDLIADARTTGRARSIPRPSPFATPTVPIADAIEEIVLSAKRESSWSAKRRAWNRIPHYSRLMGRGIVYNADGSIARIVDEEPQPNALTNDGQAEDLNVWLGATAKSAGYYLNLLTITGVSSNAPSKTTTSANLTQTAVGGGATVTEENGTGYARIQVTQANWGTPTTSGFSPDTGMNAPQKTWTAGANWSGTTTQPGQIGYAGLISTGTAFSATGVFVLWIALSGSTTVNNTQTFGYTLSVKVT